jgi:hypothetical protein
VERGNRHGYLSGEELKLGRDGRGRKAFSHPDRSDRVAVA